MKKLSLLFLFLLSSLLSNSQSFKILKDTAIDVDAKGEVIDPLTYIYNQSNKKLKFRWVKVKKNIPQKWQNPSVGDKNLVYTQSDSATFELGAKDSGQLFVNFYAYDDNFNPKTGKGIFKLLVYPVSKGRSAKKEALFIGKTVPLIDTSVCKMYTVPSGDETYNMSGKYFDTIMTPQENDSIIIIDLKVKDSTLTRIDRTGCNEYTVPSGDETYSIDGIYRDTIPNGALCDSILLINLTIQDLDTGVTKVSNTLKANLGGANYQWLNCNNSYSTIQGAKNRSLTPSKSGNYAVEVTKNGCTDTSKCYSIQNVGVLKNDFGPSLKVYPNPTTKKVKVKLGKSYKSIYAKVTNISGKIINEETLKNVSYFPVTLNGPDGYYLVTIESKNGKVARFKVLKK